MTGVSSGSHPFLLFARHGTFELYVGEPLMLVQTMTYGDYEREKFLDLRAVRLAYPQSITISDPVAKARLGLAAVKSGARASALKAWHMSL